MPVNYILLKEKEQEIINEFLNFYDQTLKIVAEFENYLSDNKNKDVELDDKVYDEIIDKIRKNELIGQDLLSNCIWTIQKNEPRASHLRFIIAIIYSIRNLNNITRYTNKICKWLNKEKLKPEFLKVLIDSLQLTYQRSLKIYNYIANNNWNEMKDIYESESEDYHSKMKNTISMISTENGSKWKLNNKELIEYIYAIGRIERIVDMQDNIINDLSDLNEYR
ncbi:MAG: hypothetical protein K2N40_02635 [Ureaplasma sp.]|nr:hypothetical protein [Ureaplasma sp.]